MPTWQVFVSFPVEQVPVLLGPIQPSNSRCGSDCQLELTEEMVPGFENLIYRHTVVRRPLNLKSIA